MNYSFSSIIHLNRLKNRVDYCRLAKYVNNLPSHPTVSTLFSQYWDMLMSAEQAKHSALTSLQQLGPWSGTARRIQKWFILQGANMQRLIIHQFEKSRLAGWIMFGYIIYLAIVKCFYTNKHSVKRKQNTLPLKYIMPFFTLWKIHTMVFVNQTPNCLSLNKSSSRYPIIL